MSQLYYLQSRYYNPGIGRFISADTYVSTGQGILGFNMFAYCLNNPVEYCDPTGEFAVAERKGLLSSPGIALIETISFYAVVCDLFNHLFNRNDDIASKANSITSDDINWNGGDHDHILKGTKLKGRGHSHVNGRKKFGIDPEDPNAWELLLPLLKEVVDDADSFVEKAAKGSGTFVEYTKRFVEQGVDVVVKIWISADETIAKISDAIPYIVGP